MHLAAFRYIKRVVRECESKSLALYLLGNVCKDLLEICCVPGVCPTLMSGSVQGAVASQIMFGIATVLPCSGNYTY